MTIKAKKHLSQNFLIDSAILEHIAKTINPYKTDCFIEIGPGQGALTTRIVPYCSQYTAIEIDNALIPALSQNFNSFDHFDLHHRDALHYPYAEHPYKPYRLIGNLPYHISTPLTIACLTGYEHIQDMHFMYQKEVAMRICATEKRSRLSFITQLFCDTEYCFTIAPQAFDPMPSVQSAIIRLTPKKQLPLSHDEISRYSQTVQWSLQQKRKTLANNLKKHISPQNIQALGINPSCRAETLTITQMISLSRALWD